MNTIDLLKALSDKVTENYNNISSGIPIGTVTYFPFNTAPNGFLVCNGIAISREIYSDLFYVIGTTYGSGDGSTTFNLPNLLNKFIEGNETVGTEKSTFSY